MEEEEIVQTISKGIAHATQVAQVVRDRCSTTLRRQPRRHGSPWSFTAASFLDRLSDQISFF
jgi:hypothetical protein